MYVCTDTYLNLRQCFVLEMKVMLTEVENEQDAQSWKEKKF